MIDVGRIPGVEIGDEGGDHGHPGQRVHSGGRYRGPDRYHQLRGDSGLNRPDAPVILLKGGLPCRQKKGFNFQTGSWFRQDAAPGDASLIIAGDWAPIRAFAPLIESAPQAIYGDLLPLLRDADATLVNLEAPLSDTGNEVCKSGAVFKGNTCHVKGLTAVPFTAVTLANNHMFDFGVAAFQQTTDVLERHGIAHTGAGMNKEEAEAPLVLEVRGLKIAIVNISEGEDLTAAGPGPGVAGWDIKGGGGHHCRTEKQPCRPMGSVRSLPWSIAGLSMFPLPQPM